MKERLEKIEKAIWWYEMADRMTEREREEWRGLCEERNAIIAKLNEE